MIALGRELQRRGHSVTIFQVPDAQAKVVASGLNYWEIGQSEFPAGSIAQLTAELGQLNGLAAIRYSINWLQRIAAMVLQSAPAAMKAAGVEALLVDQISPEGATVAEFLDLPFVTVCCCLIVNREDGIPPFLTPWGYSSTWWARLRNQVGYKLLDQITRPITVVLNQYRQQWHLAPYSGHNSPYSKLAQVSQQPAEFEFPRSHLPECFHFSGPYSDSVGREPADFPFTALTGQPLIYASLGTLQNRSSKIFHCIAEACVGLDAQLVIALGGSSAELLKGLPGEPLVVEYAPQLELLKKATLTITHAGLNTVLESLSNGVPMVAIPITNDQPGVGARLAWAGAGEVVPLSRLSVPRLQAAIQQVLTLDSYRQNASQLQAAIASAGGVRYAADIVEQAVSLRKPILAQAND